MPLPTEPRPGEAPAPPHAASATASTASTASTVAAAATAALMLAACVTPPPDTLPPAPPPPPLISVVPVYVPAPPPPPAPPDPADVAARRLLEYHERLRAMSAAELAREYLRLAEPVAAPETLELALLLAQRRGNGDLARALALLEPLLRNDGLSPWAAPARLLHARLSEQRRLEEQIERQAQQLREQQRRIEQLSSQLEALRAIERSLTARPPLPAAPAAPPPPQPPAAPAASAPRPSP